MKKKRCRKFYSFLLKKSFTNTATSDAGRIFQFVQNIKIHFSFFHRDLEQRINKVILTDFRDNFSFFGGKRKEIDIQFKILFFSGKFGANVIKLTFAIDHYPYFQDFQGQIRHIFINLEKEMKV